MVLSNASVRVMKTLWTYEEFQWHHEEVNDNFAEITILELYELLRKLLVDLLYCTELEVIPETQRKNVGSWTNQFTTNDSVVTLEISCIDWDH